MRSITTLHEQLELEKKTVNDFIKYFSINDDFMKKVYNDWTQKDVLAHITSRHISFASNLMSEVRHEKPNPFKGSFTSVNEREVNRLRVCSVKELVNSITNAQTIIETNIGNQNIKEIAYKYGSRSYTPLEHLSIVSRHIKGHLGDLRKIK